MATIIAAHAMVNSRLECSVCYKVFTDPRILPCGHSYCLKCLQDILQADASKKDKLPCPTCRTEFPVGSQNLQDLPKNFAVVHVISPSADRRCANVGDGDPHGPAQHVCVNCLKELCDTCSNDHTKSKATNDHTVKLLCEVTPEDIPVHKSTQSVDKYEIHTKQVEKVSHCECCQGHGTNNTLCTTANVEQLDNCQRLALDTAAPHHQEDQAAPTTTTPVRSVTASNGAPSYWRSASSRAFAYSPSASTSDKQSLLARSHSVRAPNVDTAEQDASGSSRLFSVFGTVRRARIKSSTVAAVEGAKLLSEQFFIDSRIWTYVKSWKSNELAQITKVISITEEPQAAAAGDLALDVVPLATGRTDMTNVERHMDMLQDIFVDADNKLNVFPLDILASIRGPDAQFIRNVLMNDVKGMKLIDNSLVGEKAAVKQAIDRLHELVDALTIADSVTTVQALSSLIEVVIIRTSSSLLPLVLLQPGHLYTEARGGQLRVQFINADITQQQVKAIVDPTNIELSRNGVLSGVIAQAAGDDYVKQCQLSVKKDGVLSPLSCRTTSGGKLLAAYVIHAAGLNATTYKSDAEVLDKMTTVFWNVFAEAERRGVDSIAIPAIGAGTNGVPLSIVVQAAITALLKYISTPASSNPLRDIRFVDITKWKVDKFQKVLLEQVCPSVAVTTGERATSPSHDIRNTRSGPPAAAAADLGAIGTIKSKLKSLFSSARSNSSSSKDMQVPGASSSSSSSSSSLSGAAAASGHSQDYVDGQGVQTTAHDNPRSPQGSTSHWYNFNVPLKCAGCGKVSTNAKKQQCGHLMCDACQLVAGRCPQCPTAAAAASSADVTGTANSSLTVCDDLGIGSQVPGEGSTDESSSFAVTFSLRVPKRKSFENEVAAAAASLAASLAASPAAAASIDENCLICLHPITDPEKLACGHVFCRPCIQKSFAQSPAKCPCCGCICGPLKGNQPPGTMISSRLYPALHGYEGYYTIEITYSFDSGIQQQGHPHPGTPYDGTRRVAYLPDTNEGRSVYKLLEHAFIAGLTFTIGQSVTTGQGGVITWNGIPHKTQMTGKWYGYPDPTYLKRVKKELAAKGIK